MNLKDNKKYYSLRKFKGVDLASVVVGLAFLTPIVMAEEIATVNVNNSEINTVKSVVENSAPEGCANSLKPNTNITTPLNYESNSGSNVHVVPKISRVDND